MHCSEGDAFEEARAEAMAVDEATVADQIAACYAAATTAMAVAVVEATFGSADNHTDLAGLRRHQDPCSCLVSGAADEEVDAWAASASEPSCSVRAKLACMAVAASSSAMGLAEHESAEFAAVRPSSRSRLALGMGVLAERSEHHHPQL